MLCVELKKLISEGKYVEVLKYFENRNLSSASVEEFLVLSVALYNLGVVEEAKKIVETALSYFPNDIDLIVNAAEIYYHCSDLKKAFEFAKRAVLYGFRDPYIYDIIGSYYALIGEEDLALIFGEKAYGLLKNINSEEAKEIVRKYGVKENHRKKLLIFGTLGSYIDSFIEFIKNGWEIYVLKSPAKTFSQNYLENYEFLASMGANIINLDDFEGFVNSQFNDIDVVLYLLFFNEGNSYWYLVEKMEEINCFYRMTAIIKEKKLKGKIVVAIDGGFYIYSDFFKNWLSNRLCHVDWLLFETDNLKEFFVKSVETSHKTNMKVMLLQAPLKKEVKIKLDESYFKHVISLNGKVSKCIDVPVPTPLILNVFIDNLIAQGKLITDIRKNREIFYNVYGDFAFGIVEDFYNDLEVSHTSSTLEIVREILSLLERLKNYEKVAKEVGKLLNIHRYMKVPEELLTLLQFGIVPVLPYRVNDFYDKLCVNKMAVCIDKNLKLFNPDLVNDKLVNDLRQNILKNMDMFTFDKFYTFVEEIIQKE